MSYIENKFDFTLLMLLNDWNLIDKIGFDQILDQLEFFLTFTRVQSAQVTSISNQSNQLIYESHASFSTASREGRRSRQISFNDHGPNPIIWKGYVTLPYEKSPLQQLQSFIRNICSFTHHHRTNQIKLSFGIIWQFFDVQSTGFNQLVDTDIDSSRKQDSSSLNIGDFSLGNMINGQKFVFLFRSDKLTSNSFTIDELSFQIFHRKKFCDLQFRIKSLENNLNWTFKWCKFRYNCDLIRGVIINTYQDPVGVYLSLPGSPEIYEKQSTDGDNGLPDETNQWIRCSDCNLITREIISKCRILRLSVNPVKSTLSQKKHQSLHEVIYAWRLHAPLQVNYSSTPRISVTHPDNNYNNRTKYSFEIDYAYRCIRSVSFEFEDDFLVNHGGEGKLDELIKDQIEAGKKEHLLEALYRLFYAYITGKVYDAYLHLKWLMGRIEREYEFIFKRQNSNQVKFIRQAILTPTRTLFLPPTSFRSTPFLETADTESIMRVTIRDDDLCLQRFVSAFADSNFPLSDNCTNNESRLDIETSTKLDPFVRKSVESRLIKDGGLIVSGRLYKYLSIPSYKFTDDSMIFHLVDSD